MERHLQEIIQLSFGGTPEKMLERALEACIEVSGATGGSILGEEGPFLQFLYSDVSELIGTRVPFDSIAGTSARDGMVIYTYAPTDSRHFGGVDQQTERKTRYLLSIPIPGVHESTTKESARRNAGTLQLLFEENLFPGLDVEERPQEFTVGEFRDNSLYENLLEEVFALLPNIAFGMEVVRLRQTSYQAIHELKNKLIAGLSWLDYLKEDIAAEAPEVLEAESVTQDMELMDSSIREGAALAKTYLAFTKIYEPVFEDANVNDILTEVAASARAYAKERNSDNFAVDTMLDPGVPPKKVDAAKLKMAFFNLCKNGAEALIDHGTSSPRLNIGSKMKGDSLVVTIGDNGPGMPEDIANNLFIPFKTKKEGGTGLGLTITKKIVDIHNGMISCDTGENGTTFTVTLP